MHPKVLTPISEMSTMTRNKYVSSREEAVWQFGGQPSSDRAGVTEVVKASESSAIK